jgi:hypothetical protein
VAAAARGNGVRVLDLEAAAHQIVDVVDGHAGEVVHRHRIDDHLDPFEGETVIGLARLAFEGHAVLQPGTPAARDEDAQGMVGQLPLFEQAPDARRRRRGQGNRRRCGGFNRPRLFTNFVCQCHRHPLLSSTNQTV